MPEYSSPYVQSNPCAYKTLSHYNSKCGAQQQPKPARVILPTFSAPPGYGNVSKGIPTCSGYATLEQSYQLC